ncbi:universal stress protein [Halomicrobium salinisoli]|uniref:universal stress protein n=1 Tax=Halomicrobium salinisoli TaxID=2878391 RepID=UPI001CEFCCE6|nr:universal stress protein [Halomicrobium salinisoli]
MALDTVLLALGPGDRDRIDAMTDAAVDIAGPAGATVVLVHVFTDEEYDSAVGRLDFADPAEAEPNEVARRHSTVRDIAASLDEVGIDYRIAGRVGNHGEQIVSMAEDEAADLVIVGGRKRSPTGKAVFGSTAQQVMLESPAPVTFVRGD